MDFKRADFEKFKYAVDVEDYRATYPELAKYPEFTDETVTDVPHTFDEIFRYVLLLYTPGTPLMQIPNIWERKEYAARVCSLDYEALTNSEQLPIIIVRYLRMMKNYKWSKLCLWTESFWNQSQKLLSGKTETGERTDKLVASIDDLESRIEKTMTDFLNGDVAKKTRIGVLQQLEDDLLPSETLKPEVIAKKLADGEKPLGEYSPYK